MMTWIQSPPDWMRRGLRTFLQAFLASLVALWLTGSFSTIDEATGATVPNWASLDTLVIAAGTAGLVSLVAFIQNLLEDKTGSEGIIVKK
jgi:hypothetical protein